MAKAELQKAAWTVSACYCRPSLAPPGPDGRSPSPPKQLTHPRGGRHSSRLNSYPAGVDRGIDMCCRFGMLPTMFVNTDSG